MDDCIFCKIVNGDIDCAKVFEDDTVLVFLDVNPITQGHCLVIPKQHFENIFDIDEGVLKNVIVAGKHVSQKLKKSLNVDGIRLSQSNGEVAGQAVFHFHLHVIPRYKNVGLSANPTDTLHLSKVALEELKKLAKEINA